MLPLSYLGNGTSDGYVRCMVRVTVEVRAGLGFSSETSGCV